MAAPITLDTITFEGMLGTSDPVITFDKVWNTKQNAVVTFDGEVVNDSCAADSPVIAANSSYSGPVFITFNKQVSGISFDAGCFDAAKSTRVIIYGKNGFKVERDFNPNGDRAYFNFDFQYGENVIKKVEIKPIGDEPAGFAVDNVSVTLRPESAKVTASGTSYVDALAGDHKWADRTIEWSFVKADSTRPGYGTGPETFTDSKMRFETQSELSAGQKAMVRKALGMWDDVANIRFQKVADGDTPGQLRFSRADISAPADAYLPNDFAHAGDVTIRTNRPLGEKAPGTREFTAIVLHEIGHALGLNHPHEGGLGAALPAGEDSVERSVMSYRSVLGGGLPGIPADGNHAEGPMLFDIAAIQYMYGANFRHNRGDTVYTFDPTEAKILRTIWDGGGEDTYDASAYTTAVKIDLAPGKWSILSKGQRAVLEANGPGAADDALATGNVANAYLYKGKLRSLIENATGGTGNDKILGNQADNTIDGGRGDDRLFGRTGDDVLEGGRGGDRLIGSRGDDILRGEGGRDKIFGGDGNDILRGDGGRDRMTGGAGDDLFIFLQAADGAPRERITDFEQGHDTIVLSTIDADTTTAGRQSFTFIGDAAFTAAGQLRAVVGGGDTLLLGDIDGDKITDFRVFLTGEMSLTVSDFVL